MQVRRGANIEHLQVSHGAERGPVGADTRYGVRARRIGRFSSIQIADSHKLEPLGQALIRLGVQLADSAADDCNAYRLVHQSASFWPTPAGEWPKRRADACARSASSEARKQCAWDMAVSVRLRISSTSCRP